MRYKGDHVRGSLLFRDALDVEMMLAALNIVGTKRGGNEIWIRCPIHKENEASCQIRDNIGQEKHGLWRCFGCGRHGNAGQLVAEILDIEYGAACDWIEKWALKRRHRVPSKIDVQMRNTRKRFELPAGVEFKELHAWPEPIRRYAATRGITERQVQVFGLGYSVIGYLQNRIVFPNRDRRNVIVGYSARSINDKTTQPRYLTPKEEDLADETAIFGEHLWGEARTCVVTEGAINGLALWQVLDRLEELRGAVIGACCGSNIKPLQLDKLRRFDKVIIATDPDLAGDKAAKVLSQLGSKIAGRVRWAPSTDAAKVSEEERVIKLLEALDESRNLETCRESIQPVVVTTRRSRWCASSG